VHVHAETVSTQVLDLPLALGDAGLVSIATAKEQINMTSTINDTETGTTAGSGASADATPAAVKLVQRFYECYTTGDLQALKDEVLAPDVVWHIPGRHPLSGPKHGAEEIVAFFSQLARANMQAEVLYLAGDDSHAVDVHRGWGATETAAMDMTWVLYYRIEDGRIVEVTNFAADQAQADNFFWATYQLAPVPQRLATT